MGRTTWPKGLKQRVRGGHADVVVVVVAESSNIFLKFFPTLSFSLLSLLSLLSLFAFALDLHSLFVRRIGS